MLTREKFVTYLAASVAAFLIALLYVTTSTALNLERQLVELENYEDKVEAAYDPTTGDVWIRINDDEENTRVSPSLCPKSMSF